MIILPVFFIFVVLPNFVSSGDDGKMPYLRGFWTRAEDISPRIYDYNSLREQWDSIEETVRSLSFTLIEESAKHFGQHFSESNIKMPVLSRKCSKHLFDVFLGFARLEPWAHLMLMSSSLLPSDMIGKSLFLGSYDVCIDINAKNRFQGKYCKLDISLPFPKTGAYIVRDKDNPLFFNFTTPDSMANLLIKTVAPYFYFAYAVIAVCVPSSCSADDIKAMSDKVVEAIGINFEVRVIGCQTKESFSFNAYDVVATCILFTAVVICCLGTIFDYYLRRKSKKDLKEVSSGRIPSMLACFSIRKGTEILLKDEESTAGRIFSGMQVMTILWWITCYSHWYIPLNVYGASGGIEEPYIPFNFELVRNGFLALDTLLFIWAANLMESRMKETEETGIIRYVVRKILNLAPPIVLVTAAAIVSKNVGSGPIWKETVYPLSRKCERNWWQNVLFINNYVSSSDQCLSWSWLMAADMQLYVIALLVIVPIKNKPRIGLSVIGILFATGVLASVANHVIYDLPPTIILSAIYLPDDIMYYFDNGLFPSYLHLTTYTLGLLAGYILQKRPEVNISSRVNTIAYMSLLPLGVALVCSVHSWNTGAPPPNIAISTLYSVVTKIVWCLGIGWISFSCVRRCTGAVSSFLSWKMFTILGRLTCTVYLLHPLIIQLYIGSLRQVIQADGRTLIPLYVSIVVGSYMAAYIFYILSQSPFIALEQLLWNSPKPQKDVGSEKKEKELSATKYPQNDKNFLLISTVSKC